MKPTKILFMAWGHSIHAQRRIQLFIDDPRFEVAVASNFHYGFDGAENIDLTAARTLRKPEAAPAAAGSIGNQKASAGALRAMYRIAQGLPWLGAPLHEAVTSARDLRILQSAVNRFQPDVIFLQTLLYPCYLSLFIRSDAKRMFTFWNGDLMAWARHTGLERLFKKHLVAQGIKQATAITVNSETARGVCVSYGAVREKVHLIRYPGLDLEQFKSIPKSSAKNALGLENRQLILNERGPVPHQNLDILVEAAPRILAAFPQAKFMFLAPGKGIGPEAYAKYAAQAHKLGVEHAMLWRGNVPHHELPNILSASDVAVSLSFEDSLPNSMLDAMACNVPVVVGDLPQIREWVSDGHNGFVVPQRDPEKVAEAVCALLANPALAADMASRSFRLVEERAASSSQIPLVKELVLRVAATKHAVPRNGR